jgi:hypothetical protein
VTKGESYCPTAERRDELESRIEELKREKKQAKERELAEKKRKEREKQEAARRAAEEKKREARKAEDARAKRKVSEIILEKLASERQAELEKAAEAGRQRLQSVETGRPDDWAYKQIEAIARGEDPRKVSSALQTRQVPPPLVQESRTLRQLETIARGEDPRTAGPAYSPTTTGVTTPTWPGFVPFQPKRLEPHAVEPAEPRRFEEQREAFRREEEEHPVVPLTDFFGPPLGGQEVSSPSRLAPPRQENKFWSTVESVQKSNTVILESRPGRILTDTLAAAGGTYAPPWAQAIDKSGEIATAALYFRQRDFWSLAQQGVDKATVLVGESIGAAAVPANPHVGRAVGAATTQALISAGHYYLAPAVGDWMFTKNPDFFTPPPTHQQIEIDPFTRKPIPPGDIQ